MEDRPCLRPLQPPHPFEGKTSICNCCYPPSLLHPLPLSPCPFFLLDHLQWSLSFCSILLFFQTCHGLFLWGHRHQQQRFSHPAGISCSKAHVQCWKSLHPPQLLQLAGGELGLTVRQLTTHSHTSLNPILSVPNPLTMGLSVVSEEKSLRPIALWWKAFTEVWQTLNVLCFKTCLKSLLQFFS